MTEKVFPHLQRKGKIRPFSEEEIEALRIIDCLKKSGLKIREIRQFFKWASEGSSTYAERKSLFETRKKSVEAEIRDLQKTPSLLRYKYRYYETAIKNGSEDGIRAMLPDGLPPGIQALYDDFYFMDSERIRIHFDLQIIHPLPEAHPESLFLSSTVSVYFGHMQGSSPSSSVIHRKMTKQFCRGSAELFFTID